MLSNWCHLCSCVSYAWLSLLMSLVPLSLTDGAVTLNCSKGASWIASGKAYEQYNCVLHSEAPAPVTNIKLSCSNFVPTAQWNINPDCTLPNTTLFPGQDLGYGYQTTSGPATITVTSYDTLPQGSFPLRAPNSGYPRGPHASTTSGVCPTLV